MGLNSPRNTRYGGTGAGQWNICADYVNGTKVTTLHRKFETAISTDSTYIILCNKADDLGVSFFSRIDESDEDELDINDGGQDGTFTVYLDAREVPRYLKNLTLPVIPSAALFAAAAGAAP